MIRKTHSKVGSFFLDLARMASHRRYCMAFSFLFLFCQFFWILCAWLAGQPLPCYLFLFPLVFYHFFWTCCAWPAAAGAAYFFLLLFYNIFSVSSACGQLLPPPQRRLFLSLLVFYHFSLIWRVWPFLPPRVSADRRPFWPVGIQNSCFILVMLRNKS